MPIRGEGKSRGFFGYLAAAVFAAMSFCVALPAAAQVQSLGFDDGNTSAAVDGYSGIGGNGWAGGWNHVGTGTPTVTSTNPLTPGGGNYLSVDLTGADRNVIRRLDPLAIDLDQAFTISWDWRLDDAYTAGDQDRINFFSNASAASTSTSSSNGWIIGAAGQMYGNNFYFYNSADGSFNTSNAVDTGIAVAPGTTYSFSVTVNPVAKTYDASISNGSAMFSDTGLNFRNPTAGLDYLHFGQRVSSDTTGRAFSLDNIQVTGAVPDNSFTPAPVNGYHGIWYENEPGSSPPGGYGPKYGGGLGTYPQQTNAIAAYSASDDKTFFVYGGTDGTNNQLKNMIGYYDHATGQFARPRVLREVGGFDVHQNATLNVDADGYIWVFAHSHGTTIGSGNIYRSANPGDISSFQNVALPDGLFSHPGNVTLSYGNSIYDQTNGFVEVYNVYSNDRAVHVATGDLNAAGDDINWDQTSVNDTALFDMGQGHYAIARTNGSKIGILANYHEGHLNNRTNLYYVESNDWGQTWQLPDGTPITAPITSASDASRIHDYLSEDQLVYIKSMDFDAAGNPVVMYLTVSDATGGGHNAGPQPGGRTVHTAYWDGAQWLINDMLTTNSNYDHGELWIDAAGNWNVLGAFLDGPQVWGTGGQIGLWQSDDQGATWDFIRQLSFDENYNSTYPRLVTDADDEFFALWADGDAYDPSDSRLYFMNAEGTMVYRMPTTITGDFAAPELVFAIPEPATATLLGAAVIILLSRRR